MDRMKTFFKYFLIFVGFYIISQFLIDAYIKTSYHKITEYQIDVNEATITIIEAKASRENGYIEGKIKNTNDEEIINKYMVVEIFSDSGVSLGKEYCKIEKMKPKEIKDFKVLFRYNNVKSFSITVISEEEKQKIDSEKRTELFDINLKPNKTVENIINEIEVKRN